MKNILKHRLEEGNLEMLMQIKSFLIDGNSVGLETTYQVWVSHEDKREKRCSFLSYVYTHYCDSRFQNRCSQPQVKYVNVLLSKAHSEILYKR